MASWDVLVLPPQACFQALFWLLCRGRQPQDGVDTSPTSQAGARLSWGRPPARATCLSYPWEQRPRINGSRAVGTLANISMVSPRVPDTVPSTSQGPEPTYPPPPLPEGWTVSVPGFQMKTQKQREIGDLRKAAPLTGDEGGREAKHCGSRLGALIILIAPFGGVSSSKEGSGM